MNKTDLLNFFIDDIGVLFKNPVKFRRYIKNNSGLQIVLKTPEQVVDSNIIIQWNNWQQKDYFQKKMLRVWKDFSCFSRPLPEIEKITSNQSIKNWKCEIQDIVGISASKSDLFKFKTIHDFAIKASPHLINELGEAQLNKNLLWENGSALKNPSLRCYAWDNNRIHLCNSGGSHHFSAARYIASQIGKKVQIQGNLNFFKLVSESVFSLLDQYDLYAFDGKYFCDLIDQCKDFKAEIGFFDAPPPFNDKTIVFLPHNNSRSMRISGLFKQSQIFNFGDFLLESLKKQDAKLNEIF